MTGHDPNKYTGSALYYTECGIRTDYGAVVGTVEIVDCVPVEKIMDKLTPLEMALGDYSPGRFAWVLENPVMFDTPIPARGQQGWWEWPFVVVKSPAQIGKTECLNMKIICGMDGANT